MQLTIRDETAAGRGDQRVEDAATRSRIVPRLPADRNRPARFDGEFNGDATLSILLSKAFLLADDARIADATVVRQRVR